MNTFQSRLAMAAAAALAFMYIGQARADNLAISGFAWHASAHNRGPSDKNMNETNPGLGYERVLSSNLTLAVGYYQNSYFKHTNYIMLQYQPIHFGGGKFGFMVGNTTGYNNRNVNPVIVPILSYMYKDVGINLAFLPVPPFNTKTVAALQFKIKLF